MCLSSEKSAKAISPPLSSGFDRRKHQIAAGLIVLTSVYSITYYLLRDSGSYLPPAEDVCDASIEGTCSRPDLFAFQVVSAIIMFYCGISGVMAWNIRRTAHTTIPSTPEGRLFGSVVAGEKITAANFTYQVWDLVASLLIPEHSAPIFLAHHAVAGFVTWSSLVTDYGQHYAVFFAGCSEFSSTFLVFMDLAKFFPPVPGSPFDVFIQICQPLFALSFFYYRVVAWWMVSYTLWSDAIHVISTGKTEKHRPKKIWGLHTLLIVDVVLGLLQLYWFGLIAQKVAEVLS